MPHFFFDFHQGPDVYPDAEGVEFASVEQAYLEAFAGAQEMWSELLKKRRDPRQCHFEVRDCHRELLFVFPLQEVVDSCFDRPLSKPTPSLERATATASAIARHANEINDELQRELDLVRNALAHSRALLAAKG
jgi:hypothetical protein